MRKETGNLASLTAECKLRLIEMRDGAVALLTDDVPFKLVSDTATLANGDYEDGEVNDDLDDAA